MPLVRLETNGIVPEEKFGALKERLRVSVAGVLGERVEEMRVELAVGSKMRMADSDEPLAHVTVKGVEFPKDRAPELTGVICPLLDSLLGIRDNRVYIAVVSTRNSMWRVNGDSR